jgi:hypothetical protein
MARTRDHYKGEAEENVGLLVEIQFMKGLLYYAYEFGLLVAYTHTLSTPILFCLLRNRL